MRNEEAKNRIEQLTSELNSHNHLYYVENNPTLSDFEFDQLLLELQKLELEFPEFALDREGKFKEPEMIWYPKIRCLGVQGHPRNIWGV